MHNFLYGYEEDHKASLNQFLAEKRTDNNFKVFSTVRLNSSNYYLINQMTFYHNPYVNKLWSKLTLYEYEKQK